MFLCSHEVSRGPEKHNITDKTLTLHETTGVKMEVTDLLLGGQGLGVHSDLGLALISVMRSLNLAWSVVTVTYAFGRRENIRIHSMSLTRFICWTWVLNPLLMLAWPAVIKCFQHDITYV